MYCPRCGQEQISEETKYCAKCGFPLGLISEVLSYGGFLPQLAELHKKTPWLNRKKALFLTFLWFIFFVPFMTPIWGGLLGVEELAIMMALIGFFGSLVMLVATFVFIPKTPKENKYQSDFQTPQQFSGNNYQTSHALPPEQSIPVSSYIPPKQGSWRDTNDLVAPPSITENTTKFLKKEE